MTTVKLTNSQGMSVEISSFGATITKIIVPDRHGVLENVVCGFATSEEYIQHPHFFGNTIGPFAGRLEQGIVEVNGKRHFTVANEGQHILHGGEDGFHAQQWDTRIESNEAILTLQKSFTNFPGNMAIEVRFTLSEQNELTITYTGKATEATLMNFTNHSYFNLTGNRKGNILEHRLSLPSKEMLYISDEGVPLPKLQPVENSPFTLLAKEEGAIISEVISQKNDQLTYASGGIDHPFILEEGIITLADLMSGRQLEIITDQNCVVVYTGQKIGEDYSFIDGPAENFGGICLETQNVPNSVMHKHFPSAEIHKGSEYKQKTVYRFSTMA